MITDDWRGLYNEGWKNKIVPEAISHPAKFSRSLIEHIYQHAIEQGWLKAGSNVIDPFAGVALGALDAMRYGMHWTGVELEKKFVDLGTKNITLWNDNYYFHFDNWGTARIIQGDSRHLLQVVRDADASISSPPYAETQVKFTHMTSTSRTDPDDPYYRPSWVKKMEEGYADSERPYGETPGQLGTLKDEGYDAAISSPPYAETRIDGKGDEGSSGLRNEDGSFLRGSEGWQKRKEMGERYGEAEGNLGNLKDDGFDAAISSPPFIAQSGGTNVTSKEGPLSDERLLKRHAAGNAATEAYGDDPANLGNLKPEGYDAAISSPPFAESNPDGGWQLLGKYAEEGRLTVKQVNGDPNKSYPSWNKDRETPYAMSPDNLGNMQDQGFDAAISSPPYSERHSYNDDRTISAVEKLKEDPDSKIGGVHIHDNAGQTPGNLGNMTPAGFDAAISSPPFGTTEGSVSARKFSDPEKMAEDIERKFKDGTFKGHPASKEAILRNLIKGNEQVYGDTPGNLGNMGADGFDAAVSSPPFHNQAVSDHNFTAPHDTTGLMDTSKQRLYGENPKNLANLSNNGFDAAVSSPPYAETEVAADLKSGTDVEERKKKRAEGEWEGYNRQNPGNLGSLKADDAVIQAVLENVVREQTETFWSAARMIIDQTYAALKPGGVAIWVTKSFVKNGKRVDFPGQWQRMCEAAGFVTLHRHKAWLVEDRGSQFDMFGNLIEKKVERKSFFRRLAEKKGSPRIDYEVATCMMKPKGVEHAESI